MAEADAPTLLFVDDEKLLWTQYREYFGGRGYKTLFAGDGCEAVRLTRETSVDCVVMDLRMPHVDGELGIEVLQEVKPELPIIVVSGYVTPDQVADGMPGAFRVFLKPVDMSDLLAAVEAALAGT